jgi:two-component system response regulator YesN
MKRVLIVDDEYLVRLGLKTIIDWAEHGYAIAGEAVNGREALELFNRLGADVILTDIKMPIMDGLELTRAIKAKNKQVKIIILSHYDEFAYAQEAINLGAFRYILKSELTRTNLLSVLQSIFDPANETPAVPAGTSGGEDAAAQREHYIDRYLLPFFLDTKAVGVFPPLPEDGARPGEKYIILCAFCRLTTLLQDTKKMFPKTVKVLFAEAFSGLAGVSGYRHERFEFAAVLSFAENDPPLEQKITESCTQIVKNIQQYYDANLFIGLSSAGKAGDMARLFGESSTALELCFFSEKNFVGSYYHETVRQGLAPPAVSHTKISGMIQMNQKEELLAYIQDIFSQQRELKNYMMVHNAFIDFLSIGKAIREKYRLHDQTSLSENKFDYAVFYDLPFISDVELYIRSLFLDILAGKQGGEISYSFIVKKSITFIQQNYPTNISLSDAAVNAGVSHSYLSFIFKQETGINFNTWLSRYRVEEAKSLLRNTNLRIYQVAEKVGFSNPYYFSKVFKEAAGVSCKEFRDTAPAEK